MLIFSHVRENNGNGERVVRSNSLWRALGQPVGRPRFQFLSEQVSLVSVYSLPIESMGRQANGSEDTETPQRPSIAISFLLEFKLLKQRADTAGQWAIQTYVCAPSVGSFGGG